MDKATLTDLKKFITETVNTTVTKAVAAAFAKQNEEIILPMRLDVLRLDGRVDQLTDDVTGLKTDVAGLKTDVTDLKTSVSGLQSDTGSLKADVSSLKGKVERLDRKVDKRYNQLDTKVDELATLTFNAIEAHTDDHESRIQKLELAAASGPKYQ